jgi:hypothetical protein
VPLVEQELLILLEHLRSSPVLVLHVTRSVVLCVTDNTMVKRERRTDNTMAKRERRTDNTMVKRERRKNNTMAKRERTKELTTFYKTYT